VPISPANLLLSLNGTLTAAEASASDRSNDVVSLTSRLASGEEEAFREFHALYFDRLYQFLLVVARGQEHEAQEALQETMLRVARYARGFETEEAFWSWLKVVARSAARDAGRKQRRYLRLLQNFALHWQNHSVDRATIEDSKSISVRFDSPPLQSSSPALLLRGGFCIGRPLTLRHEQRAFHQWLLRPQRLHR
jgi:RNA polymerase sigma factor (sigma-70 family)